MMYFCLDILNITYNIKEMLKIFESIQKMPYIHCANPNHECSPLNLVCADPFCANGSLLCIHCQQENHETHDTLHIKQYLKKLLITTNTDLGEENLLIWTENIEKSRSQCVGYLANFKDKVVEMVDGLIYDVERKYRQYGEQIKHIAGMKNNVENFIRSYQSMVGEQRRNNNNPQPTPTSKLSQSLHSKLAQILKYAKTQTTSAKHPEYPLQPSQQQQKSSKITSLSIQIKILSTDFSQKCASILKQIKKCQEQFYHTSLNKIYDTLGQKVQTINIIKSSKFSWSQTFKTSAIVINGSVVERKTGSNLQRFALFEQQLKPYIQTKRKASWLMKITKLLGWIGLGVCIKEKIVTGGYKFNYQNLGHGSYMISSNGYSWSSSVKANNSAYYSGFSFGTGDFVIVEFEGDPTWKLNFYVMKESVLLEKAKLSSGCGSSIVKVPTKVLAAYKDKPQQIPLSISVSNLTKSHSLDLESCMDYTPCVNLCSSGDSVEIVC